MFIYRVSLFAHFAGVLMTPRKEEDVFKAEEREQDRQKGDLIIIFFFFLEPLLKPSKT